MIDGVEFERRIRRVSELREIVLTLRRGAQKAYDEGRSPYKPVYDVRSDVEYWRKLSERKKRGRADGKGSGIGD